MLEQVDMKEKKWNEWKFMKLEEKVWKHFWSFCTPPKLVMNIFMLITGNSLSLPICTKYNFSSTVENHHNQRARNLYQMRHAFQKSRRLGRNRCRREFPIICTSTSKHSILCDYTTTSRRHLILQWRISKLSIGVCIFASSYKYGIELEQRNNSPLKKL